MILLDASALLAHLTGQQRGRAVTALACAEPGDSIATLDAMLAQMARNERIDTVEL